MEISDLQFEGVIDLWLGIVLAAVAAIGVFTLYRRETRTRGGFLIATLPLIRAVAVALIVLMLTGPVIRGSVKVGGGSRVIVFVDGSQSMNLTDETMSAERKLLAARQFGWISPDAMDTSLYDAAELLAALPALSDDQSTHQVAEAVRRQIDSAVMALPSSEPLRRTMQESLLEAANEIARRAGDPVAGENELRRELARLRDSAAAWQQRLAAGFREQAMESSPSDLPADGISARLDQMTRWDRASSLLLDGDRALLPNLAGEYQVELFKLSGRESQPSGRESTPLKLWRPSSAGDFPETFEPQAADGPNSDLATQIDLVISKLPTTERVAVVLLSDGQHNYAASGSDGITPLHLARLLGRRGVPLFPVGFGASEPPPDVAILAVQTPTKVFADDRVSGSITLKDEMPAGKPMTLKIEIDNQVVWRQQTLTTGANPRTVHFDFSIDRTVENRMAAEVNESDSVSVPLPVKVSVEEVEGEARSDNNTRDTTIRAITRPRRALVIDARPRWEFRYLRNLLSRDEHWQVNEALAELHDGRLTLPRSRRGNGFPLDRETLFAYDVIVIGDVPVTVFRAEEFEWIDQFVASRGGGLILIDGQRGKLRSCVGSPLEKLLPVRWSESHQRGLRDVALVPTTRGLATSALALGGDPSESALQWSQLPRVRWLAPVEAAPGCEILLDANAADGGAPAMVMRRYGAGTVLYSGFDDTWRWRYEVADLVHQRYWNQLTNFVMESPFSVHDRYLSIDTGGSVYQPGQTADLKVRLRDAEGQPVLNPTAKAVLYQDDRPVATVPLSSDPWGGGVLRGTTQPLDPGMYEVGIEAEGFDQQRLTARAEFAVVGTTSGELNVLSCNEDLLRQLAAVSGGHYLREENARQVRELLSPHFDNRQQATELTLWRSWYYFLPLVTLFTIEWLVRKRVGLM